MIFLSSIYSTSVLQELNQMMGLAELKLNFTGKIFSRHCLNWLHSLNFKHLLKMININF